MEGNKQPINQRLDFIKHLQVIRNGNCYNYTTVRRSILVVGALSLALLLMGSIINNPFASAIKLKESRSATTSPAIHPTPLTPHIIPGHPKPIKPSITEIMKSFPVKNLGLQGKDL